MDAVADLLHVLSGVGPGEHEGHEVALTRHVTAGLAVAGVEHRQRGEGGRGLAHADQHRPVVVHFEDLAELVAATADLFHVLGPHVFVAGLVDDGGVRLVQVGEPARKHLRGSADEGVVVQAEQDNGAKIAVDGLQDSSLQDDTVSAMPQT